jgi:plastocyanin
VLDRRRLLQMTLAAGAGALARAADDPATAVVDIRDYKFLPPVLSVKAGTTVKWTNSEKRTTHSVQFLGPEGLESERLFPGDAWQRRFDKPGSYPYTCGPHPEMKGGIEVVP